MGISLLLVRTYTTRLQLFKDKLVKVIACLFILAALNFLIFDYLNLMVDYATWLKRGMPPHPFCRN